MEFDEITTYEAASAAPTQSRAVSAPAIGTSATVTNLNRRLEECQKQLIEAIDNLDRRKVRLLRDEIRDLKERIPIAELSELRERVNAIENEIKTQRENQEAIREARVVLKNRLDAAVLVLEDARANYNVCQAEHAFAENTVTDLRVERRDKQKRIDELTAELKSKF